MSPGNGAAPRSGRTEGTATPNDALNATGDDTGPDDAQRQADETAAGRALTAALQLAERGYVLAPVTIARRSDGKKRARFLTDWGTDAGRSADPDQLADWSAQHACSYAIVCEPSGIEVVDLDGKAGPLWWAENGLPVSGTVVDTPSGGQHVYWRRTGDRTLVTNAGQVAPGVDARTIGGVVFAPGSWVLGEADRPYAPRAGVPKVTELEPTPDAVLERWEAHRRAERPADGAVTRKDRDWALRVARELRERVRAHNPATDGGFRALLMGAAMVVGRMVDAGVVTEGAATRALLADVTEVWGAPDGDDREWIRRGVVDGPARERWELADPPAEPAERMPSDVDGVPAGGREALERLRAQEWARSKLAQEQRRGRPSIADGVVDDLDNIAEPVMLLGGLIPDAAVGFLSGLSGAYKTFLAAAWACCIATGTPWLGRPEFAVLEPRRTLYVAAEGRAGAAGRIRAWEAATGLSRAGRLLLYGRPIHLNDPAQVEELAAYVHDNGIRFLVIDTYHRSAPNADESSNGEFGVIFEAAARLRDEFGCSVLFVDHTGHNGGGRPRGPSGKGDDADYVLSAMYAGATRGPEVPRTLTVIKLKDEESDGQWPIRLRSVDGQRFPVVEIGAPSGATSVPLRADGDWWNEAPAVPDEVHRQLCDAATEGRGVEAARWIWRLLVALTSEGQVLTRSEIGRYLRESPGKEHGASSSAVQKACKVLEAAKVIVPVGRTGVTLARLARPA